MIKLQHVVIVLALLFANLFINAMAATAHISTATVPEGRTLQLTLTWDGEKLTHAEPELSPLKHDFYIYGIAKGSQIQIINGRSSAKQQWTITLLPKSSGIVSIPALTIGSQKTQTINVQVNKINSNKQTPDIFIEANWLPKQPYVQSQIVYTVKIFYDLHLVNGQITNPDSDNIIVNRLQDDKQYQATHNGKLYNVIERQYALFPKVSGNLIIKPPMFVGEAATTAPTSNLFTKVEPVQAVAPAIKLQVNPQPANYSGDYWLPSKEVTLTGSWSNETPTFKVGEAITRTITLRAKGLSAEQLPNIPIPQLEKVKTYPDKPILQNIVEQNSLIGTRQQKIAYIPTNSGEIILPEITLTWFDTVNKQTKVAKLPKQIITVATSNIETNNTTATLPTTQETTVSMPTSAHAYPIWWIIAASVFAILWLFTLIAWYVIYKRKRKTIAVIKEKQNTVSKQLCKQLKRACQQQNYKPIANLLLEFARQRFQDKSIINLRQIICYLHDEQAKNIVVHLDKTLYAPDYAPDKEKKLFCTTWQSIKLVIDAIQQATQLTMKPNRQNNVLPKLYK